jgi:hypothetical protein
MGHGRDLVSETETSWISETGETPVLLHCYRPTFSRIHAVENSF